MQLLFQNIIQAIRSLRSQGWQVGISAVSLAVGIVSLTYSYNWLWSETNYDSFRPDYKNLYLGTYTENGVFYMLQLVKEDMDSVGVALSGMDVEIGKVLPGQMRLTATKEDGSEAQVFSQAMDTTAFKLLGMEVLRGSIDEVFEEGAMCVAVTDSFAMRIFGTTDVIGRSLKGGTFNSGGTVSYPIKAVIRDNDDNRSSLNFFQCISRIFDYSGGYLLIHTTDADAVRERLKPYASNLSNGSHGLGITPLRTAYKMRSGEDSLFKIFFYQIAFTLISLLLVVSAVVNLIMVFTSIYLGRVREYALRRSMGATAWQNVQWMVTAIVPTFIFAFLLASAFMEWVGYWGDLPYKPFDIYGTFYRVAGVTVALILSGMLFPIYNMRRAYRASFLGHGDGGRSHVWLIVVQCMASAMLLFISLGMQNQIHAMVTADLGYERDNILRLHTGVAPLEGQSGAYDFDPIFSDLVREIGNSGADEIVDVVGMRTDIFNRNMGNGTYITDGATYEELSKNSFSSESRNLYADKIVEVNYVIMPYHAFDFFGIKLKSGATLQPRPNESGKWNVVLDSVAMSALAFNGTIEEKYFCTDAFSFESKATTSIREDFDFSKQSLNALNNSELLPIGAANVRLSDFKAAPIPLLLIPVVDEWLGAFVECDAIYIKHAPGRRDEAEAAIRKVLEKFDVPEEKIGITTLDEYIADCYDDENYYAALISAFTLFSVVVTLAGVFSMLLYSLRLRRRSMAIHRVMGAEFKDIFMPTLRPYLIYAVIGAVVAYVPATLLMRKWMEIFHYGEAPGVGLMLAILCAMVAIITLIVWWQVRLCMREKPVEILKPES